jgi:hypothetical protein
MNRYLVGIFTVILTSSAPAGAEELFGNLKKAIQTHGVRVEDAGKAVGKASQDTGRTIENAARDTGSTLEKAPHDTGYAVEKATQPDASDWMAINREQGGAELIPVDSRRHKM